MTGVGDVPDEAVRVLARMRHSAACLDCGQASPGDWAAAHQALADLAAVGWVLVPGPVHTEWGAGHEGAYQTGLPRTVADFGDNEAAARRYIEGRPASMTVVSRRVTEWRQAESTQDGDRP